MKRLGNPAEMAPAISFLLSDDGQYITDGEISVIENGQFIGLDGNFERLKNQSVFATLDKILLKQILRTSFGD